jgi:bacteriocin biosynthesis cyclodehydratase domain-containing protein
MMAEADFKRLIALSHRFSVHVVDSRQVLLLSEERSFRLVGKLYVAMLPFLDGTRTGLDIFRAFAGRASEGRLRTALGNVLAKGYADYVDDKAPPSRQALWAELGMVPADVERNLAQHSIALKAAADHGAPAEAVRLLHSAVEDNGIRVVPEEAATLTIVSVEDYLHRDLEVTNQEMRQAARSWMLFKAGGRVPLLGPLFRPDAAPCWACLANRMVENRPGDRLVSDAVRAVRPALAHTGGTLGIAANFAALHLARCFARDGIDRFDRRIVSFDLRNYRHREHLVRLDPHCEICGAPYDEESTLQRALSPLKLQSRHVLPQVDGGWRTSSAAEVLKRLEDYVSPITGIIADLEDTSPKDGLPVFQAKQTNPVHTSPRENRLVGRPGAAAGKGMEKTQAQASCLGEAIERYLCGYTGREPRMRTSWAALNSAAPHPYTYLNYSEKQYVTRDTWNKSHEGFNWVGERFDENREIEWTPAWSMTHGERRWLPTRYCYFNYVDPTVVEEPSDNDFCAADSNGCASGSTLEEAILQGFLELVERDACALWWYNRVRRPAFDLDASENPFVRRVRAYLTSRERGLEVLDVTNDIGIPVAIAVSHRQADGKAIAFGLGAHFDPEIAVSRALAELNQMVTLEIETSKCEVEGKGTDDSRAVLEWIRNKSLETEPYCVPDGIIRTDAYERPRIGDLKEAVERCVQVVSNKGFEMIVLDHSRPEIDFAAARVVVPGMRHFWARLRAGRLYQAPVDMGWLDRPLSEENLNPIAFFL